MPAAWFWLPASGQLLACWAGSQILFLLSLFLLYLDTCFSMIVSKCLCFLSPHQQHICRKWMHFNNGLAIFQNGLQIAFIAFFQIECPEVLIRKIAV